ncbi:MAG: metal-dependent transcriptional regulator [Flavobacteriales bacterium]|nr:metal-dependent transcriptional regulator [Flavobacteriales bacterium]
MSQSFTEENYLKAIYKLSRRSDKGVSTNALAERMETKASSVTDMLKKLAAKKLVNYEKYQGVTLSKKGQQIAVDIIRKHRLWEVFLLEHLGFSGEEVHQVAEELEHINSETLIDRLDKFLGYPKYDPHGGPIPDSKGVFPEPKRVKLDELEVGRKTKVMGITEHSDAFLSHLKKLGLELGTNFHLKERFDFDRSVEIELNGKTVQLSYDVAKNIFVSHNS